MSCEDTERELTTPAITHFLPNDQFLGFLRLVAHFASISMSMEQGASACKGSDIGTTARSRRKLPDLHAAENDIKSPPEMGCQVGVLPFLEPLHGLVKYTAQRTPSSYFPFKRLTHHTAEWPDTRKSDRVEVTVGLCACTKFLWLGRPVWLDGRLPCRSVLSFPHISELLYVDLSCWLHNH